MTISSSWKYKPTAIRIEIFDGSVSVDDDPEDFNGTPSTTFSASALFLINQALPEAYIVSVSPRLSGLVSSAKDDISVPKYRLLAAVSPDTFTDSTINWYPVTLQGVEPLTDFNSTLRPFLTTEYELIPKTLGISMSHSEPLAVTVLQPSKALLDRITIEWGQIDFCSDPSLLAANRKIRIESSPFVLVNPVLFSNYLSIGTLSYLATPTATKHSAVTAIFSDARYLDGMDGGPVFQDASNTCIGFVAGALHKKSGQGDLSVIVPWDQVYKALSTIVQYPPDTIQESRQEPSPLDTFTWLAFHGVLLLEVYRDHLRQSWGSGILLADDILVTNSHMIENGYRKITAWISTTESVELEELGNPLPGIDIIFFKVKWGNKMNPKTRVVKPAQLCTDPKAYTPGRKVYSLGYGLIYPRMATGLPLQPLRSLGIISNIVSMPLFTTDSTSTPVMLVSSACCWNGSSGGAVFDAETGRVISLMTSNGRVNETGQVIPQMAFTLPALVVARGLAMLTENQVIEVNPKVETLWQLRETHESLMVEDKPLKAKL
ncbi:uncharacterized protein SAPINGB_P002248 [Magnusiomyces paraingens]|uniref:Serine protease n=1 Tax=Magnusiomyces paraingens TaxID=2606893 RepID=A0A5E8BF71_9ASCO|nr:uncharacterized protein SAPINGB_P002248 [Saprochaete ingens]VVT49392.1 unnamed protein product [Saprochaete ingens]